MEGGKGGRWAWRVCYDAMNRMGWRKGGYVDDVVCFLESSERALRETQSHLQAARRSRARYIRPICVYICRILSGDRTLFSLSGMECRNMLFCRSWCMAIDRHNLKIKITSETSLRVNKLF